VKQVVVDASFCAAWNLTDKSSGAAERLLTRVMSGAIELMVPALWHYEMLNLLRSAARRKRLAAGDMDLAVDALKRVPMILEDLPGAPARRRPSCQPASSSSDKYSNNPSTSVAVASRNMRVESIYTYNHDPISPMRNQ